MQVAWAGCGSSACKGCMWHGLDQQAAERWHAGGFDGMKAHNEKGGGDVDCLGRARTQAVLLHAVGLHATLHFLGIFPAKGAAAAAFHRPPQGTPRRWSPPARCSARVLPDRLAFAAHRSLGLHLDRLLHRALGGRRRRRAGAPAAAPGAAPAPCGRPSSAPAAAAAARSWRCASHDVDTGCVMQWCGRALGRRFGNARALAALRNGPAALSPSRLHACGTSRQRSSGPPGQGPPNLSPNHPAPGAAWSRRMEDA
eukprot:350353-Chlamydomonas_euryale.AAC.4